MGNWHCVDCNVHTGWDGVNEYYMVHDKIWKQTGMDNGMLCIGCLEERIGRTLTHADFKDYPINTDNGMGPRSLRLLDRLTRP